MTLKRFTKVSAAVWRSKRFKTLPTDAAKLLYLYFVTSDHQTSIGAYAIPDGYALDDLGWDLKAYSTARKMLVDADLIAFDPDTSAVYVLRWFKHSPPMNESHAQGCIRLIGQLESDSIRELVETDFDTANKDRNPIPTVPQLGQPTNAYGARGSDKWPVRMGQR